MASEPSSGNRDRKFSEQDYYKFYMEEKELNKNLEQELAFHRIELQKFKNEAAKVYALSQAQRKDKVNLSSQAEKILKDLHLVNRNLRTKIKELDTAKKNIHEAYKDTINRLVLASEYKDNETGNHILRMSNYSVYLAEIYGFDAQMLEEIELAAPMHDVGKIGIKDSILFKNGKLTDDEFNEMKRHTIIGGAILENPDSPILECARLIALCHHEKWNGRGYPNGIKAEEIPIHARIVSISDTFDALTSKRPYKTPYPVDVSCDIIKKGRGEDFDPDLVDLFLSNIDGFVVIKNKIDNDATDEAQIKANFAWSERDRIENKQ
ncbi:MAG: HD domain-containing protein [Chitinispirillia bacterium]|nr:HD domain-containing protein [Chitinispirillia bacterium]MCL2267650.1 HD domain-containing protein [Chitinispirillia bacterium]